VFAFVMSSVRVILLATIALGPILAGALGSHLITVGSFQMYLSGPAIVLFVGGLIAVLVSLYAGRQVGGLAGSVLRRVFGRRRDALLEDDDRSGVLIAVEGAGTADVNRYAEVLSDHVGAAGWLVDRQTAPSSVGRPPQIQIVAGRPVDAPSAALRSIADLADLAADGLRPALDQGSVVVCVGYVDALVVRFGAEGGLDEGRILRMAQWATGGLRPDLTLVVDQVPVDGSGRRPAESDSAPGAPTSAEPTETEPEESPVDPAQAYRDLAASAPERYLVVDPLAPSSGSLPAEVSARVDSTLRLREPVKAGIRAA